MPRLSYILNSPGPLGVPSQLASAATLRYTKQAEMSGREDIYKNAWSSATQRCTTYARNPIPIHTNPCQSIPIHTNPYQPIPIHTNPYQFIPIHTNPYQSIPFLPLLIARLGATKREKQQEGSLCLYRHALQLQQS